MNENNIFGGDTGIDADFYESGACPGCGDTNYERWCLQHKDVCCCSCWEDVDVPAHIPSNQYGKYVKERLRSDKYEI